VCGALAAIGALNLPLLMVLLVVAAVLGDALNYAIGRHVGPRVWQWEQSRFFNRAAFDRTHAFYEKHGAITIIVARFLPFVRTFAPFVAGVAEMTYPRFALYNVVGGVLWICSLTLLGYAIGNLPWVKEHFSWVALALIVVPGLPAVFEVLRHTVFKRRGKPA
jgi:membrane-associated protein